MLSLDNYYEEDEESYSYQHERIRSNRRRHKHKRSNKKRSLKKKKLKKKKRHKHNHENEEDICAVCLSDNNVTCQLLPCDHKFHGKCIANWVERNFSCPLCRQEIEQFIPLKGADTNLMERFESIWYQHYSKGNSEVSSDKEKFIDEIDLQKITNQKVIEVDITLETVEEELKPLIISNEEYNIKKKKIIRRIKK
jgi:hypothetical protein